MAFSFRCLSAWLLAWSALAAPWPGSAQPVTHQASGALAPQPARTGPHADTDRPAHSRAEFPVDGPCRWLPVVMPAKNPPGPAMRTKAELDEQFRIVQGLQRFLASAPILDPPIGVCPELVVDLVGNGRVAGHAFRVRLSLGLRPAMVLGRATPGGALVQDDELRWIWIRVNEPDMASLGRYRWDSMADDAGRFFPEPEQTGWFQGFPVHGQRVTITRDPSRPLVRPVRLDRALRWLVADRTRALAATTGSDATSTQRRAALERQRDEAATRLATLAPAEAGAAACLRVPSGDIVMFDGVVARGQPGCGAALV